MNVASQNRIGHRRTAAAPRFSSLIPDPSAHFTFFFPNLRSGHRTIQRSSSRKPIPSGQRPISTGVMGVQNALDKRIPVIAPTATISNIMGTTPCIAAELQEPLRQIQPLLRLHRPQRRAWDKGLKTNYYLRTLQASNIEKATIDVKKEQRGDMVTQTATTTAAAIPPTVKACSLLDPDCESCQ